MLVKKALPYALGQFFIVAFQWGSMIFLPVYFKERGITAAGTGTLISIFSLATLILVFPLGALSDRMAPRPMMLAGALLAAAANVILPAASSFAALAAGMAVAGAGYTLAAIALSAMFFKQLGEGRRGAEVAVFSIGGTMGAGAGAWIAGVLAEKLPLELALFPTVMTYAAGWAVVAIILPRTGGISFPLFEYRQDLRRARTWALIAIMFVTASHSGFEQSGYTLLQTEKLGLPPRTIGDLFLILTLWMSLITVWTGKKYDRAERPILMLGIALIVSGAFMAASGSARGAADFLLYRVLHTAGDSVFSLLTLVLASLIFPRKRFGGAFAFALTVNTAAYFTFANVGGIVGQQFGFDSAFHLSGLILVSGGVVLLLFRRRLRKTFRLDAGPPP